MISATIVDPPARAGAARDAAMTAHAERAEQGAPPPSAERYRTLVDAHVDFMWRSLLGLGVPAGSPDDTARHVFLIAYQELSEMAPGREHSFLFGTALGVAANARRAGALRRADHLSRRRRSAHLRRREPEGKVRQRKPLIARLHGRAREHRTYQCTDFHEPFDAPWAQRWSWA
ncbi:hypothetical protein [Sorangium sp. So ce341]|uniref:hypothetical protein n=1 Tax=Sorangium sp. So ce341 TaxID=3133302 RepID=UPI003F617447